MYVVVVNLFERKGVSMKKIRNVRLQVFVSSDVDDRLDDLCEIMGLHKNEIVRVAIANYLLGITESVNVAKSLVEKEFVKEFSKAEDQESVK